MFCNGTSCTSAVRALAALVLVASLQTSPADSRGVPRCAGKRATIVGTASNDRLIGSAGPDVIYAKGGNDSILGRGGRDFLCGGTGEDNISGGGGNDRIYGHDSIRGGTQSPDVLDGGAGNDWIDFILVGDDPYLIPIRDGGDDSVSGGVGDDTLAVCNDGYESLSAGKGRDMAVFCEGVNADLHTRQASFEDGQQVTLDGFEDLVGAAYEADVLIGDDGPNFLSPGYDLCCPDKPPEDRLEGNGGDDEIQASPGDVVISGGDGDDNFSSHCCNPEYAPLTFEFVGGPGDDTMEACVNQSEVTHHFVLRGGDGSDTAAFCFETEADLQTGSGVTFGPGTLEFESIENLRGGFDNDRLSGDGADNVIEGGEGNDYLDGREGRDELRGGEGADVCLNGETVSGCDP